MTGRRFILTGLFGITLLCPVAASHADETVSEVPSSLWASPRSAEIVAAEPAIAGVVQAWHQQPRRVIVVRHAPGESAELRASELRGWLVALGVPSDAIDVRISEEAGDRLRLLVR